MKTLICVFITVLLLGLIGCSSNQPKQSYFVNGYYINQNNEKDWSISLTNVNPNNNQYRLIVKREEMQVSPDGTPNYFYTDQVINFDLASNETGTYTGSFPDDSYIFISISANLYAASNPNTLLDQITLRNE